MNSHSNSVLPNPPTVNKWAVMVTVMCGLFMVVMDFNIVTVALPAMMHSFRTTEETIKLVVESYALSYAVFTLTGSWLREQIGIRKTFLAGLVLFTVSSLLCGLSWNLGSMVVFRILKGIGGGVMMPTGFTMLSESFPPNERGRAFGIFGTVIVFAPSIGPTLGGYLVDFWDWRYVFFINIPIGALVYSLASTIMKDLRPLHPTRFDTAGFLGLGCGLGAMLATLNMVRGYGWNHPLILSLFGVSAATLILFVRDALRSKNPIIDLKLFSNIHFSILSVLNFIRSVTLFARIVLLPLLFQNVLGYSALHTGLMVMPGAVSAGVTMPVIGPFIDRYGPRWFVVWGFILQAAGSFMFYNIGTHTSEWYLVMSIVVFGIGSGLLGTPISSATMNVVFKRNIGQASIIMTVVMQVGQAFGVAVFGTLVVVRTLAHTAGGAASQIAHLAGYREAFVGIGILCLIGLIPTLGIFNLSPPAEHHEESIVVLSGGE